jgi:hypothetical protein
LFRTTEDADRASHILESVAWDKADKDTVNSRKGELISLSQLDTFSDEETSVEVSSFLAKNSILMALGGKTETSTAKKAQSSSLKVDASDSYVSLVKEAGY